MLVLERSLSEKIRIGNNIEIMVTKIKGDRVWFGITAPKSLNVVRTELDERDKQQCKRGKNESC